MLVRIDALLNRIVEERIPILASTGKPDAAVLSVDDRKLLGNIRFRYLIVKRLNAIAALPAAEIKRLLVAIEAQGPDLGGASDLKSIQTLLRHWSDHPDVRQTLTQGTTDTHPRGLKSGSLLKLAAAVSAAVGQVTATSKGRPVDTQPLVTGRKGTER